VFELFVAPAAESAFQRAIRCVSRTLASAPAWLCRVVHSEMLLPGSALFSIWYFVATLLRSGRARGSCLMLRSSVFRNAGFHSKPAPGFTWWPRWWGKAPEPGTEAWLKGGPRPGFGEAANRRQGDNIPRPA